MVIFEIVYPGTDLDLQDSEWHTKATVMLRGLESAFTNAALAANLFEQALAAGWDAIRDETRRIDERVKAMGPGLSGLPWADTAHPLVADIMQQFKRDEVRHDGEMAEDLAVYLAENDEREFQAELKVKHALWEVGQMPHDYTQRLAVFYGRAFLTALDEFQRHLEVLENDPRSPDRIRTEADSLRKCFPELRDIRNSDQHLDERLQAIGSRGKKIKPHIVTSNIRGKRFGHTLGDGTVADIEVSIDSMRIVQSVFQNVVNAFSWSGRKQHIPR